MTISHALKSTARNLGIPCFFLTVVVLLIGGSQDKPRVERVDAVEVAAQSFVLKDDKGRDLAVWAGAQSGSGKRPFLMFLDAEQRKSSLTIGLGEDGHPAIIFLDKGDTQRLFVSIDKDGLPMISLRGKDGTSVLTIAEAGHGDGVIEVRSKASKTTLALGFDDTGEAFLLLFDEVSKKRLRLRLAAGAEAKLIPD